MKLIMERWRNFVDEEKIITEWAKRTGMSEQELREGISRRGFLKGLASVSTMALAGCDVEYNAVPLKTGSEAGPGDTGASIPWEGLPGCVQDIEMRPSLDDERWTQGIPAEEVFIVGRNEEINVADIEYKDNGQLFSEDRSLSAVYSLDRPGLSDVLSAIWNYVPDTCDFWQSEHHGWTPTDVAVPEDQSTMDVVWGHYETSPLLRVNLVFPVELRDGKVYIKLDPARASGVSPEPLDNECVRQYLETIGHAIEDYQT